MLHIDFETRSRCNLITDGAYNYATDPSTAVLMMAWAFDDELAALWLPAEPFPRRIIEHIQDGGDIAAFNAQFERLIFWYVLCPDLDIPEPTLEQFYCVAAQSRANNMPGNLADCSLALNYLTGNTQVKNYRGNELIKIFCIPNGYGDFNTPDDYPEEWREFIDYCLQDVNAERDIHNMLRKLTDAERDDYEVNELINDRGLMIDRELAAHAVNYANDEQLDLLAEIDYLTGGDVKKARGKFITEWIYERLDEDCQRHMHTYKKGVRKLTLDKNARARLMDDNDVPILVREVVEYADFAQASSTGKFKSMLCRADPGDDRVRGAYIFNGASGTGRYSSRGLQLHNMPRKVLDNSMAVRAAMLGDVGPEALETLADETLMQALKGMLRPAIIAKPGHTFVCGDLSQIEGRVNPWLAISGSNFLIDRPAQKKLDLYADPNIDVYCETAGGILGEPIDKDDDRRQGYGKVPELSLGFGGGVGAFQSMARQYGVKVTDTEAEEIKEGWRYDNPWAQPWWKLLFNAAVEACNNPGTPVAAGKVSYLCQKDYLNDTLWCLLPSGRLLCYPAVKCEWTMNKFGSLSWQLSAMKATWKPKQEDKSWPRINLWPGLLCENVTQAAAADILRGVLGLLEFDWTIENTTVGHTHDDVLLEVLENEAQFYADSLADALKSGFSWTKGLPLDAEIWINPRFKK